MTLRYSGRGPDAGMDVELCEKVGGMDDVSWHAFAIFKQSVRSGGEGYFPPVNCPLCNMELPYKSDGLRRFPSQGKWIELVTPHNNAVYKQHFTTDCPKFKLLLLSGQLQWLGGTR